MYVCSALYSQTGLLRGSNVLRSLSCCGRNDETGTIFISWLFSHLLCFFFERGDKKKLSWMEPNWSQLEPVGSSLGRSAASPWRTCQRTSWECFIGALAFMRGLRCQSLTQSERPDGRSCHHPSTVTTQREGNKTTDANKQRNNRARCSVGSVFNSSVLNVGAGGDNFWEKTKTKWNKHGSSQQGAPTRFLFPLHLGSQTQLYMGASGGRGWLWLDSSHLLHYSRLCEVRSWTLEFRISTLVKGNLTSSCH